MNSEKVKEIKEKLQEEIFIANSFGDKLRKVPTKELENLLTLINELESENERLRKCREVDYKTMTALRQANTELNECMDEMQDRIDELENENVKQLKQFAEMLKEKAHKGASRDPITYKFIERDYTITESELKELLKEYEK